MKKALYYYLYICDDFEINVANKCHKEFLNRYISIFDSVRFFIAVDNIESNYEDVLTGVKWVKDICGAREFDITIIKNDKERCETKILFDYIIPNSDGMNDEFIFLAHNKGTTNMTNPRLNNESVLRWIMAMYWYSLEYNDYIDKSFTDGKIFYGALKANFAFRNGGAGFISGGYMYPGSFYWINPSKIKDNIKIPIKNVLSKCNNRWVTEDFPMCFDENLLGSYNDVKFNDYELNPYFDNENTWKRIFSKYGDADKFIHLQNEILELLNY